MKKFTHPLMDNNITQSDVNAVVEFLKNNKKKYLLNQVKLKDLRLYGQTGRSKYSVFVPGSSSNLLTLQILKILFGSGEVIVPPLTWISDVAAVLQNNFKPIFVDINPENLCMDEELKF